MSSCDESNIKKNYIVQSAADFDVLSACTAFYTNNIYNCTGGTLTLHSDIVSANTINASIYLSGGTNLLDIFGSFDNYTTGATLVGTEVVFDRTNLLSAYTLNLSTLVDNNTFVTGFTYDDANTFTISDNSGSTFNATFNTVTGLTVTGGLSATTLSACTGIYTSNLYGCSPITVNDDLILLSGLTFSSITQDNSLTQILGRNSTNGDIEYRDVSSIIGAASADTFVTGFTYNDANTFTISDNSGSTFNATINNVTGLTSTGDVEVVGNIIVTGGTGNVLTKQVYVEDNLGLDWDFPSSSVVLGNNGDGTIINGTSLIVNGDTTINGNLSATTISATTYFGDGSNLTGIPHTTDTFVSGGTYSDITDIITFTNTTGGTFDVTGITDTFVTGVTLNSGNYKLTTSRNDTFNIVTDLSILASDVKVTGGTYDINTGIVTFTNNSGGTFNVTGFTSGMTDTFVTGGTLNSGTLTLDRQNGSVSISGFVSTFTGNTSGDCITDLYITNLYGCSPITVYDNLQHISSSATGVNSIAWGSGTTASGDYSHAEGLGNIASGKGSHAEGGVDRDGLAAPTSATTFSSHAEGWGTLSSGWASHSEGHKTIASGNDSHAEGSYTTASEVDSHAEGYNTTASGEQSHAEGYGTIASNSSSHAEGKYTTASGTYSHSEGYNTTASGNYTSHAEGYNTTASGEYGSHAEGYNTIANGSSSHAEGRNTISSGLVSHAEGTDTTASGIFSHAEGGGTLSSGRNSHSQGFYTIASGGFSHAGGGSFDKFQNIIASGDTSFVHFKQTSASGIIGAYGDYSAILGGTDHNIGTGSTSSGIFAGSGNTISDDILRSAILGGSNITGTTNDTVYVPNLNIDTTPSVDNSLTQILSRDSSDGTIKYRDVSSIIGAASADTYVTGGTYSDSTDIITFTNNTGGTFNVTGITDTFVTGGTLNGGTLTLNRQSGSVNISGFETTFTGNTSGDCITDLWVTNISGCSPVTIGTELIVNDDTNINGHLTVTSSGTNTSDTVFLVKDSVGNHIIDCSDTGKVHIGDLVNSASPTSPTLLIGAGKTPNDRGSLAFTSTGIGIGGDNDAIGDFLLFRLQNTGDSRWLFQNASSFGFVMVDRQSNSFGSHSGLRSTFYTSRSYGMDFLLDYTEVGVADTCGFRFSTKSGTTAGASATNIERFVIENGSLNTKSYFDNISVLGVGTNTPDTNVKLHVSGDTLINGGLTANTINLVNTPTLNNSGTEILVRNSSTGDVEYRDVTSISADTNTFVTGFTYDNINTFTISDNSGSTFNANINVLSATTISATTYFGDGSNLTGISTDDNYVTGGTFSTNTLTLNRQNGSVTITGFTSDSNTTITGFTYNDANTFTISDSSGTTFDASINIMTGLTVNGESVFSGTGTDVVQIYGSGSTTPILRVEGSAGELFSITDSLTGELFAVNNISAETILSVNSDNTILWGDPTVPSLNTTVKKSINSGLSEIYSIPVSAYTGGFFEYTVTGSGARAGSIMSIFSGTSVDFNETTTNDIGDTSGITFDMNISGGTANLTVSATTNSWEIRTIVRSI
tara:strand:+ start:826 stop:5493 length:4668 start_codon:yes stop_codon:yes gene_type:complete